jgi:hypothetical protein
VRGEGGWEVRGGQGVGARRGTLDRTKHPRHRVLHNDRLVLNELQHREQRLVGDTLDSLFVWPLEDVAKGQYLASGRQMGCLSHSIRIVTNSIKITAAVSQPIMHCHQRTEASRNRQSGFPRLVWIKGRQS